MNFKLNNDLAGKVYFLVGIILFLIIYTSNLYSETWTKVDGTKPYILNLFFPENNPSIIAVSSETGDYEAALDLSQQNLQFPSFGEGFQISLDSGKTFGEEKLLLYSVFEIIQQTNDINKWYASVRSQGRGGIAISTDNGNNWNTDFLLCDGTYQLLTIVSDKNNPNRFFGAAVKTDNGFIYTENSFSNCLTNQDLNIQSRSIAISPHNSNLLFLAADNFYDGGVYRSYNNGQNWIKSETGLENFRIHCVLPSSIDPAIIYCGADSVTASKEVIGKGIFRSLDTGTTWKRVGAWGASVYDIKQHSLNSNYLVAACGYDGVWFSGNGGRTWEPNNSGLPTDVSVRTVSFPYWNTTEDGVIAYAGLFGAGLYKSKRVVAEVNDFADSENSNSGILKVFPQPAIDYIVIEWDNPNNQYVKIELKDIFGRTISFLENNYYFAGKQSTNIKIPQNITDGIYIISIYNDNFMINGKFTVIK